jgi:predicted NAD-dependent protein-ADP-ribosyltransferase YbiA (DUF1768 family)
MRLISILSAFLLLLACHSQPLRRGNYPAEWWKAVPRDQAKSWEILPQDAGADEVILSKRGELGILSNFAETPFDFKGKHYASVEGFWQMLKFPEGPRDDRAKNSSVHWPFTREQVAQMTAFEAKTAGNKANAIMKQLGIEWVTFEGRRINYLDDSKGDFYRLIWDVEMAKLRQNPGVRAVLLKTGDLKLMPDHHQEPTAPPAWHYDEMWMEIRAQIRSASTSV